jgi:hypothetical protein
MAAIPFDYECDRESGFVLDPNSQKRVGYITTLDGLGLAQPVAPDLNVSVPYNGQPKYTGVTLGNPVPGKPARALSVVGVIEKFSWEGGAGNPIVIDFWCSQGNAVKIRSAQQVELTVTQVNHLGWWIIDYDQEAKVWFEQSFPVPGAITGSISGKEAPALNTDLNPVPVKDGIDVNVYKVTISVAPAANQQFALQFANSAAKPLAKSWGLVVGKIAGDAS